MTDWIKCSDRLPPSYQDILVTDGERCWVASIFKNIDVFIASNPDYKRHPNNKYGAPFLTLSTPIYWMPLPEKPKNG